MASRLRVPEKEEEGEEDMEVWEEEEEGGEGMEVWEEEEEGQLAISDTQNAPGDGNLWPTVNLFRVVQKSSERV